MQLTYNENSQLFDICSEKSKAMKGYEVLTGEIYFQDAREFTEKMFAKYAGIRFLSLNAVKKELEKFCKS